MGRDKRRREDDDDVSDVGKHKHRSSRRERDKDSKEREGNHHKGRHGDDDDAHKGKDSKERDRHKKQKKHSRQEDNDDDDDEEDSNHRSSSRQRQRHGRKDDHDNHSEERRRKKKKDSVDRSKGKKRRSSNRRDSDSEDDNDDDDDNKVDRDRHHRSRRHDGSEKKKHKKSSKKKHHRSVEESDDIRDDDNRKSRKSHQRKDDDKKGVKIIQKKPDKSSLHPMGGPLGHTPETLLDAKEDYYNYHQEFWVYLFREEGIYFNDLDATEAHVAFGRFCKRYNAGELEEPYYSRTLPTEVIEESKTTKHSWTFKTTEAERQGLEALHDGVRRQTDFGKGNQIQQQQQQDAHPNSRTSTSQSLNPTGHATNADPAYGRQKTPEERLEERRENKRLKETVRTVQEELLGGPKDLRERQLEKKRELATRIHGASNDRDDGVGVELTDSALYGDVEQASFQSALARERRNKEKREEQRTTRIGELQSKEEERQQNMLKLLGLQNLPKGQKITIAPRKDG